MVDFRYHIVSIIAVFLGLALGIVLGTYTINPRVVSNLRDQVSALRHHSDGLQNRVLDLQSQSNRDEGFVSAIAPTLLRNRLTHCRITVVLAPGASSGMARDVTAALTEAGGTVTSTVSIERSWIDPAQVAVLGDLANRLAEPGATLPTGTAYERAATVIASALLDKPASLSHPHVGAMTSSDTTALAGFSTAKLIRVSDHPSKASCAVLVAADGVATPTQADRRATDELVALARGLGAAGAAGVVVGRAEADQGSGLITMLRAEQHTDPKLSTVDDADTTSGLVRTVLALSAQLHGTVGQYGVGSDATAQAPTPSPTPSPIPTSNPGTSPTHGP